MKRYLVSFAMVAIMLQPLWPFEDSVTHPTGSPSVVSTPEKMFETDPYRAE